MRLITRRAVAGQMDGKRVAVSLDRDKGRAVLHLLESNGFDRADLLLLDIGDDITDDHAFGALSGRVDAVLQTGPADPPGRSTAAAVTPQ